MNKQYIKYIGVLIFIIILGFTLKVSLGRSIPNPYEENKVEVDDKDDINILYSFSDLSNSISLGKQNLITGAYAKRTLFIIEINQKIDNIDQLKSTKLYLNKDIVQNDNFFYKLNDKVYGIFVVDNSYDLKEIENMKIVNEELIENGIFNEEMNMTYKKVPVLTEGLVEVNDIFNYNNVDYLRLPNNTGDTITFLPLKRGGDSKHLNEDDLKTFDIDSKESLQSLVKANLFELDMNKYLDKSSLSLIKLSFFKDVNMDKVAVSLIDSDLFIPMNDGIIRQK